MKGILSTLYLFLLLFLTTCATAQREATPPSLADLSKKETKGLEAARTALARGDFPVVVSSLNELLRKHPAVPELWFLRSESYRGLGQYERAAADIRSGMDSAPEAIPAVAYRKLGEALALAGDFSAALKAAKKYRDHLPPGTRAPRREQADALVRRAVFADSLAANPVPFSPTRLSDSINTDEHLEYFPTLSIDGQRLVFTRRVNREGEDFYYSERDAEGSWQTARPLPDINTTYDEGAQSITADGKFMVYTVCNRPEGAGSCDLFFSEWREGTWTPALPLPDVNTAAYEAQPSISPDGRLLFFSSNRPGGAGGNDLYASARLAGNRWSAPLNLGPNINTPERESYPFWAADGKTLFFTSNGHPGLGGEDLFRVILGADNTWGQPENLGYPINTAANETNIFIPLNGDLAYFSKREIDASTGLMDVDIHTFPLPPALRPAPATYVAATVTDAKTGAPLRAEVRLRPLDQDTPPRVQPTDGTGQFLAVLPAGRDYAFTVDLPGYLFFADRFSLTGEFTPDDPFRLDVRLQPVAVAVTAGGDEADGSTAFRNVLFNTGSAALRPVSHDELDRLANLLAQAADYRVTISGHTDDVGAEADNLVLSERRAVAVKEYLVEKGIAADRIRTQGFGESQPVASNDTESGRARNRRTTFRLTEPE